MLELPKGFVSAPIQTADMRTHYAGLLCVFDLDSRHMLKDCVRIDCEAGIAWRMIWSGGRAHPIEGRYVLVCRLEEAWRWMKI